MDVVIDRREFRHERKLASVRVVAHALDDNRATVNQTGVQTCVSLPDNVRQRTPKRGPRGSAALGRLAHPPSVLAGNERRAKPISTAYTYADPAPWRCRTRRGERLGKAFGPGRTVTKSMPVRSMKYLFGPAIR